MLKSSWSYHGSTGGFGFGGSHTQLPKCQKIFEHWPIFILKYELGKGHNSYKQQRQQIRNIQEQKTSVVDSDQ